MFKPSKTYIIHWVGKWCRWKEANTWKLTCSCFQHWFPLLCASYGASNINHTSFNDPAIWRNCRNEFMCFVHHRCVCHLQRLLRLFAGEVIWWRVCVIDIYQNSTISQLITTTPAAAAASAASTKFNSFLSTALIEWLIQ